MDLPQRNVSISTLGLIGLGVAGVALGSNLLRPQSGRNALRRPRTIAPVLRDWSVADCATVIAARRLNRAAGTLAASVLADSAVEHYRGSFKNKAMFTPLVVSALTLATSCTARRIHGLQLTTLRDAIYALAAATGLVGTGFHIYNVGKKVGGFSWQNLFYCAPLGAPFAILLSGLIGFCSERVRDTSRWEHPDNIRSSGRPRHGRA